MQNEVRLRSFLFWTLSLSLSLSLLLFRFLTFSLCNFRSQTISQLCRFSPQFDVKELSNLIGVDKMQEKLGEREREREKRPKKDKGELHVIGEGKLFCLSAFLAS